MSCTVHVSDIGPARPRRLYALVSILALLSRPCPTRMGGIRARDRRARSGPHNPAAPGYHYRHGQRAFGLDSCEMHDDGGSGTP